ncbi:MAG: hypothetical protein EOO59_04725 [Hymenobacter sp.]|nr:MAG: hypothetical protein EOO59_04725 [Hymenobacter sp.]
MASRSLSLSSPLLRFTLLAVGLYLLWFVGYEHYLAPDERLDTALTQNLAQTSAGALRLLGFAATASTTPSPIISLGGQPLLSVWHPCNGLVLYALFSGFVVAFPGPIRTKLWFIPLGIFLIYCLNLVRVVVLALNSHYSQQTVDFNHHYTFTFIVYACIFALWMWWATRLAKPATAYAPA